jgi:Tol biopolymer transport system component
VLFIDARVADGQTLLAGVEPGIEVHWLDPLQDEIAQITQVLLGRSGIDSLHLVSHGSAGRLQLGATELTATTLNQFEAQVRSWQAALSPEADILLYGCNVAQGEVGQTFVQQLSHLTAADVAASENITGSAGIGGDWQLEFATGTIEAGLAFSSSALQTYGAILPTSLVSIDDNGLQGGYTSGQVNAYYQSDISADGRYVVFSSDATGLAMNDYNNNFFDVFVQDRKTNTTRLLSLSTVPIHRLGINFSANGHSYSPTISADGRFVVFYSAASNISASGIPYDGTPSVYVHDLRTRTTTRIATNTVEAPGNSRNGTRAAISADGRYIVYETGGGMTNEIQGLGTVYLYDQQTQTSVRIGAGRRPTVSDDGRFVAYQSDYATYSNEVFLIDRQTGTTTTIDGNGAMTNSPGLSATGRYLVFVSYSSQFVANDTNRVADVFVYDQQTRQISRVSVDSLGGQGNGHSFTPSISADGRYVAFHGFATNFASNDTNISRDVFRHDRLTGITQRVSVGPNNQQGDAGSFEAEISANGQSISFASDARTLVVGDRNDARDIFVYDFTPFEVNVAPVLQDTPVRLNPVGQNAPAPVGAVGTLVSQLVGRVGAGGPGNVSDGNAEDRLGIAITSINTGNRGTWYFSLDNGSTWQALGSVSDGNARLLAANATTRLYFQPARGVVGQLTNVLQFRAWDQISGQNGGLGGAGWSHATSSLSSATDTLDITVERSPNLPFRDFNGDGFADVFWLNPTPQADGSRRSGVWQTNGSSVVQNLPGPTVSANWQVRGYADFNRDGKTDILWFNTRDFRTSITLMNGNSVLQNLSLGAVSANWQIAGIADFNGDLNPDILWRNRVDGRNSLWQMNRTSVASILSLSTVSTSWQLAGVGDFDGDGKADMVWQNAQGRVDIWRMNGNQSLGATIVGSVGSGWQIAGLGDFNGDGRLDILWRSQSTGRTSIWQMNGSQLAQNLALQAVDSTWHIAIVADFNQDGKTDIVWRRPSASRTTLWQMDGSNHQSVNLPDISASWVVP